MKKFITRAIIRVHKEQNELELFLPTNIFKELVETFNTNRIPTVLSSEEPEAKPMKITKFFDMTTRVTIVVRNSNEIGLFLYQFNFMFIKEILDTTKTTSILRLEGEYR